MSKDQADTKVSETNVTVGADNPAETLQNSHQHLPSYTISDDGKVLKTFDGQKWDFLEDTVDKGVGTDPKTALNPGFLSLLQSVYGVRRHWSSKQFLFVCCRFLKRKYRCQFRILFIPSPSNDGCGKLFTRNKHNCGFKISFHQQEKDLSAVDRFHNVPEGKTLI